MCSIACPKVVLFSTLGQEQCRKGGPAKRAEAHQPQGDRVQFSVHASGEGVGIRRRSWWLRKLILVIPKLLSVSWDIYRASQGVQSDRCGQLRGFSQAGSSKILSVC